MNPRFTKVRDGSIALPPEVAKAWKGVSVYVIASGNLITARRVEQPSLTKLLPLLKKAGKGLRQGDIEREIRTVRKKNG